MSTIYSFGYKFHGEEQFARTGPKAPLIIDARVLDNPHSDPELRRLTGMDGPVLRSVWACPEAKKMVRKAVAYLRENPEGVVAFGCSYGRHRSVALAELTMPFLPAGTVTVIHTGKVAPR